jgi:hypothetical protein
MARARTATAVAAAALRHARLPFVLAAADSLDEAMVVDTADRPAAFLVSAEALQIPRLASRTRTSSAHPSSVR